MKKLLILGAMQMHIPLLKRAKERGIYTITCDYIPENEGHIYADEAHFDSTTDFEAVLKLASDLNVDGIMTFNSDPAALTAAYVGEQLGLPNSGFDAVKIMSEKDLFRDFLAANSFNCPKHSSYTSLEELNIELPGFKFPVVIKPVDSSGSKGVTVVYSVDDVEIVFNRAIAYSRSKRVIVEEYISLKGNQFHGDGMIIDGKLSYCCLGDHHFNASINNIVPISTTFPSSHTEDEVLAVQSEVDRFIQAVGFKQGGINIEARIAQDGKVYLIEVGARNGGNFTPIVIQHATGYNFIDVALSLSLGLPVEKHTVVDNGLWGYLILHSKKEGTLGSLTLSEELESICINKYIYLNPGDKVLSFKGANAALGVILVKFIDKEHKDIIIEKFNSLYKISLV